MFLDNSIYYNLVLCPQGNHFVPVVQRTLLPDYCSSDIGVLGDLLLSNLNINNQPGTFTVGLRVPSYVGKYTFTIDGKRTEPIIQKGYSFFTRQRKGEMTVWLKASFK